MWLTILLCGFTVVGCKPESNAAKNGDEGTGIREFSQAVNAASVSQACPHAPCDPVVTVHNDAQAGVDAIKVVPASDTLEVGQTAAYFLVKSSEIDGDEPPVPLPAEWASSAPAVLTVVSPINAMGNATVSARAPG